MLPVSAKGPWAIVGMACRFPGNANSPAAFWKLLCAGGDAIVEIPPTRFDIDRFYDPDPSRPGRLYVRRGGLIDDPDGFDAAFFNLSRREAAHMDPQQRILLELAWEALEDAGYPAAGLAGSRTGVFVGISSHDFASMLVCDANREHIDAHTLSGMLSSVAANRISYVFDLRGPSLAVDTACSSSLTALHLARRSLEQGECDLALVAGVNLFLAPEPAITMSKASILSPDGHSKAFDARANGYVRGEGAGFVLLKSCAAAESDGDRIYAVLRSTAINQDGRTLGMTVPSAEAQTSMMRAALDGAGLTPRDLQYVEAHGTGTPTGDPIEADAIGRVYGAGREHSQPCLIGSVKTNIGHLEAGAGIAGLVKTALALRNRAIPPSLHFEIPNPAIPFEQLGIQVVTECTPWPLTEGPARAGVNSFGLGGANAHAILEEPPRKAGGEDAEEETLVLLISAKTQDALRESAERHTNFLSDETIALGDICYTAAVRRTHHPQRLAIVASRREDMRLQLEEFTRGDSGAAVLAGSVRHAGQPKIAFVYSGMGLQRPGMGSGLLAAEPVFREVLASCDRLLRPAAGWSLLEALQDGDAAGTEDPEVAQVTNFALQAALTALWRSWGVKPAAFAGHSAGEVAAAYGAGALTLQDGLLLTWHRGRLARKAAGKGAMLAAAVSPGSAVEITRRYDFKIDIAAFNSADSVTFTGDRDCLEDLARVLAGQGSFCRLLPVTVPYHSRELDPLRHELLESVRAIQPSDPASPMVSSTLGNWVNGQPLDADHWWENFRKPVQFARTIQLLVESGVELFLEVGPHAALRPLIAECLTQLGASGAVLSSLKRGEDDRAVMLRSAAMMHVRGCDVDWKAVFHHRGCLVSLPSYPWQHESFGLSSYLHAPAGAPLAGAASGNPLLGTRLPSSFPCWHANLAQAELKYLEDHAVQGTPVFPAAAYVEMGLAAAAALSPAAPVTIEHLEFTKMLALPKPRSGVVQWASNTGGGFEVVFRAEGDSEWASHASGQLGTVAPTLPHEPFDLDAVRKRCKTQIQAPEWYAWCEQRGLQYGESFRGVETIWRGQGEALGRIRIQLNTAPYRVHPALFDCALQLAGAAAHTQAFGQSNRTLLPASIQTVRHFGFPGSACWSYVKVRSQETRAFEADIHLLDDDGNELVAVERLRCVLVGAAKNESDRLLYRVEWREHRFMEVEPFEAIGGRLSQLAPRMAEESGISEYYPRVEQALNRLAAAYIKAALGIVNGQAASRHALYLERLRQIAVSEVLSSEDLAVCRESAANLRGQYPKWTGALNLIERCGEALADVLIGKLEPHEILFGPDGFADLVQFYRDLPCFAYYYKVAAELAAEVVERLGGVRLLRVLEVGAGTGGATSEILSKLPKGTVDYVFTDISPFFLSHARIQLAGHEEVRFCPLDMEKSDSADSLPHREFDLIIASDVLHATGDLHQAVANVKKLLAPGGRLILIESSRPIAWVDMIFGLLPGWWRFSGCPVRGDHPLLSREQWLDLLREANFDATEAIPAVEAEGLPAQVVVVARNDLGAGTALNGTRTWLVVANGKRTAATLAGKIARAREKVLVIGPQQALPAGEAGQWAGAIYLADPDQPNECLQPEDVIASQAAMCQRLIELLRSLVSARDDLPPIWIVTVGAQQAVPDDAVPHPEQAALWGLGRVLASEFPNAACHLADLSGAAEASEVDLLVAAILSNDPEDELVFRGGSCFGARVAAAAPEDFRNDQEKVVPVSRGQVRLEAAEVGSLQSLSLRAGRPLRPGPGQLLVRVKSAGLNFRDVMMALGLLELTEPVIDSRLPLGLECAGVVVAVGVGVQGFLPGDEVIGVTHGAFASHAILRAAATVRKPEWLGWNDAGGILAPFTTVQHSLHHLARLEAGERVLIHSATGGVGLAAIQYCQSVGAEIFATAGSPEKRGLLRTMGIGHVMDSRSLEFADQIEDITNGEGIDVVLNSLPGPAISAGLSILRPGGRFVELGKRDLLENTSISLGPFQRTLAFFSVDLELMFRENTARVGKLSAEVIDGFERGRFSPLPRTDFALSDAAAAFRLMSQARHTGKIVLDAGDAEYPAKPTRSDRLFRRDATYLVTGGLGGFGLEAARWMVSHGARHVVLMGRRDVPAAENAVAYRELIEGPARVRCLAGDVSREADLERVLSIIRSEMPPLAGVLHAAMVLEDRPLLEIGAEQWNRVLAPKVVGAWLLDRLTATDNLECFVLFSSAASIVGTPAQGAYAAANAFLDALAAQRRARGLAGLSISWGPIAGTGYVSRHAEVERYLEHYGLPSFSFVEALDVLESLWRNEQPHAIAGRVRWVDFRKAFPARRRFSELHADGDEPLGTFTKPGASSPIGDLLSAEPGYRDEAACRYVIRRVAGVLTEPESKIDPDVPLTKLGLDSLMAVELQTLFHNDAGLRLPATRLLQGITARELADLVLVRISGEAAPPATAPAAVAAQLLQVLPLAREQRRLWFLQQLNPESPVYNVPMVVRFTGALDTALLRRALMEVAQRHAALRASFQVKDGEPVQIIARTLEIELPEADLTLTNEPAREFELQRLRDEEALAPFDLTRAPLIRARLFRLAEHEHTLFVTMHHFIVDAFSLPIIARDHATIYRALATGRPNLLPPAPDYCAYVERQQQKPSPPEQLDYWKTKLAGVTPLLLPTDRSYPPRRTFGGDRLEFTLESEVFDQLEQLGRSEGATLFMTLLAAFQILLYRHSGQTDFCVGAPVATRAREEAENLVGCLVNSIALRSDVSADLTFRELLRQVRRTVLEAFENQDVSWEDIVRMVSPDRDASRPPIFQVLLVVHQIALETVRFPGITLSPEYVGNRSTTFDLVLLVDSARRELAYEYNTDIFDRCTIERMILHWRLLLGGIVKMPECSVTDLAAIVAPPKKAIGQFESHAICLNQLFEAQVNRSPDAIAVCDDADAVSYRELDCAANRIALLLRDAGLQPEGLVAVCMERSALNAAAILGVLKAGGAFVPLDPTYPDHRLTHLLQDAAPQFLLIQRDLEPRVHQMFLGARLALDWKELTSGHDTVSFESAATPSSLAYVMYTSGSTGQPKGVMIEHAAIVNQMLWRQSEFPLDAGDAVLQTTSQAFDPSVWEILGPLVAGARSVVAGTGFDGAALQSLIRRHSVTVLQGVPSLFRSLLEQKALDACPSLRHIFIGGEALDGRLLTELGAVTDAAVHHLYGCTETAIDATFLAYARAGQHLAPPIGRAIANVETVIVDQNTRPLVPGAAGELCISGMALARGYLHRPDLTGARFIVEPNSGVRFYRTGDLARLRPDGNLEILGRVDRQIKLRGVRIEPGEIEVCLRSHPEVAHAIVARRDVDGEAALVAWIEPRAGRTLSGADLPTYLARQLPRFMLPQQYVMVDALPLTPSGKIDIEKLPTPPSPAPVIEQSSPEATALEQRIAQVWGQVLGRTQIGLHDDFFQIGGHSLLAVGLAARLSTALSRTVSVSTVLASPTVSELARAIAEN